MSFPTRSFWALAASGIVVLLVGAVPAGADHILATTLVGEPAGAGTLTVNFVYQEFSSDVSTGDLRVYFGDGTYGCFGPITAAHPLGPYVAELRSNDVCYGCDFRNCGTLFGTFLYTITHPFAGTAPDARVSFSHTYSSAGAYRVTWAGCCVGNPQGVPIAAWMQARGVVSAIGPPVTFDGGGTVVLAL